MSDIVERLKSPAVLIDNGGMVSLVAYEAADEITRLRAELAAAIAERDAVIERAEKYQRTAAELSDKLNGTPCAEIRWQYERAALREALEPFARLSDRIPDDYEDGRPDVTITLEKVPVKVIRAARAALDGTEPR